MKTVDRILLWFVGLWLIFYLWGNLQIRVHLSPGYKAANALGHWHQEVDPKTGWLYAAPGYCYTEVDCGEGIQEAR